jgi:fatty-acyl-CoA synthase
VPDARWGEAITAIVEVANGEPPPEASAVTEWVKLELAHYKAPKHVLFVEDLGRAANGKLDYRALRERAIADVGSS